MANGVGAWVIFVIAAMLEVGGDAVVRIGLRGEHRALIVLGCLMLGGYGLVVNSVAWDFSKMLGVYVAFFAFVSIVSGWVIFGDRLPLATWVGLAFIVSGGVIVQFGGR